MGSIPALLLLAWLTYRLVLYFKQRKDRTLAVGGVPGRRLPLDPGHGPPPGFSSGELRWFTTYGFNAARGPFADFNDFTRRGVSQHTTLMTVYHVTDSVTQVEIPFDDPDYQRIDASDALALLRELPNPWLVKRLIIRDAPSYLDPWVCQISGRAIQHFGHANPAGVVVLYRPSRGDMAEVRVTLLHEWVHLLGFASRKDEKLFNAASMIEYLDPVPVTAHTADNVQLLERWAYLGEHLCGVDRERARNWALAAPVHSYILWRGVARNLVMAPAPWTSTRAEEFRIFDEFMREHVRPKAREVLLAAPRNRIKARLARKLALKTVAPAA